MSIFPIMSAADFAVTFPELHHQVCEELGIGFVPDIFRCVAVANPDLALSSWNMVRKNLCSGSIPRTTKELMFSYIAHKKNVIIVIMLTMHWRYTTAFSNKK